MKVAFFAPLKSPEHAVPSGDRQMARALIRAMTFAGHQVEVVSSLRCFSRTPHGNNIRETARIEAEKIVRQWGIDRPDLWFSYHPYYKAPDFLALEILKKVSIPVMTAESSLATKRDNDAWAESQKAVRELLAQSQANFYFTDRDLPGLKSQVQEQTLVHLPPFIDVEPLSRTVGKNLPVQLVTMGMMRGGVKFQSYEMLARALTNIEQADWQLTIIGDGKMQKETQKLFEGFSPGKISWAGGVEPEEVLPLLAKADLFVWPGFGEAYGLAYLEAQSVGLPVVAQNTHGVPAVVKEGETAILTPVGDVDAYGQAMHEFIEDERMRQAFGARAKQFIARERNLENAAAILDREIRRVCA